MKKFGVILELNKMKSEAKREWSLFIAFLESEKLMCEKIF